MIYKGVIYDQYLFTATNSSTLYTISRVKSGSGDRATNSHPCPSAVRDTRISAKIGIRRWNRVPPQTTFLGSVGAVCSTKDMQLRPRRSVSFSCERERHVPKSMLKDDRISLAGGRLCQR